MSRVAGRPFRGEPFLFNLAGLPYKGFFDTLLIGIGFVLNAVTAWAAQSMAE